MQTLERNKLEIQKPKSPELYRYLGLLALAREVEASDEFLKQQIVTELAESLDTEMGTHGRPIELRVLDGQLIDSRGTNMTESAFAWYQTQLSRAQLDNRLDWFADFARVEAEEHVAVADFAQTALDGHVMMVRSLFPEEAYAHAYTHATVGAEGFRPDSKRAFIRIYEKQDGTIKEHIQSIDSSNLQLWNQVFGETEETTKDFLTKRHLYTNISAEELIERTSMMYDNALYEQTGVLHRYGKPQGGTTEANSFVLKYPQVIADTIRELREIAAYGQGDMNAQAERTIYDSKALLSALHEQFAGGNERVIGAEDVREMRSAEGAKAAEEGKTFYGCSGQSTIVATTAELSSTLHIESFTMKNKLEVHQCVTCPMCNRVVDAIRDPKTKSWTCPKTDCKGYNKDVVSRLAGNGSETKDFGEWLRDLIFGDEAYQAKKQIQKKQRLLGKNKI